MTHTESISPHASGASPPPRVDLQLLDPDRQAGHEPTPAERFADVQGSAELQAALLALLLPARSQRARRAWQIECASSPDAEPLRAFAQKLAPADRLPWFDALLHRMRAQPLADRQALVASTRRVMGARGSVRAIDRLHWLAMRLRLGEAAPNIAQAPAARDLSQLPDTDVAAIAVYSAFLSRMVPDEAIDATPEALAPGLAWYADAMAPWSQRWAIPPCEPPTSETLVQALGVLQALPWMQRPSLVRGWVTVALQSRRDGKLTASAADALRLSCTLLDSPMPPELARHFGADPDTRRR